MTCLALPASFSNKNGSIPKFILRRFSNGLHCFVAFRSKIYPNVALTTMKTLLAAPIIVALVYRAYSHKSLTPLGIGAAFATAVIHAIHPWSMPLFLLVAFYLSGTKVTKVRIPYPSFSLLCTVILIHSADYSLL